MKRILLTNEINCDNQIQLNRAIGLAQDICKKDVEIKSCIFYIPTQTSTDPIEKLLGDDYKKIGKGFRLNADGPGVRILTDKTIQNVGASEIILISIYCGVESVKKADELYNCKAIIAIPWLKDDLNDWASTWGPIIVNENGKVEGSFDIKTISSSIVKNAVDEFPSSKSISHKSDENSVASTFKILRKQNMKYDTSEIASYLVREKGWTHESAEKVGKLGDKINDGKRIQAGSTENNQQAIERWKE